jgi:hypothetical protein
MLIFYPPRKQGGLIGRRKIAVINGRLNMIKMKEEFERIHREIAELQIAIMDQAGKDLQQVSSMAYQISREYGEISRRIAAIEKKIKI